MSEKRDIACFYNEEKKDFDISVSNGDLTPDVGLETAVWMSLFTEARAPQAYVGIPQNRGGWMGNLTDETERELGGYLYFTDQSRINQDTLNTCIDYAQKSLNRFIEDETATRIDVSGEMVAHRGIRLYITIYTGKDRLLYSFPLWEATLGNIR